MLVLASASPRRRELLTQAGYQFRVHPADIAEDLQPGEDAIVYVTRLAREKAEAVYRELMSNSDVSADDAEQAPTTTAANPARCGGPPLLPIGGPPLQPVRRPALQPSGRPALQVLGADTTVTLDNTILGKPEDAADAARMLRLLSGRTHRVITGVALVTAKGAEVAAEVTAVRFLTLSDQDIADYIATGEPMDKAGAYAIQGRAARWIPRVEGCYFNVVGLPLALVCTLLESCPR
jgi:septum formation protein